MDGSKTRAFLALQLLLLCYALSTVMQKLAAQQEFLSLRFLLWAAGMFLFLDVYALCWQQVLKRIELSTAYLFKGTTLIFTMLFAALLFGEAITIPNIIGSVIIIAGITLLARS